MLKIYCVTLILGMAAPLAANTFAPNHYSCKGEGVELSISIGKFPGPGHMPGYIFMLEEKGHERVIAHDSSLIVEKSVFGEILSTTTEFVPDYRTRYISFVLPRINLDANTDTINFSTLLIETQQLTTWAGPDFVRGLVDRSQSKPIHCLASYVSPMPS